MENFPSVLIGTVTSKRHDYVFDRFISSLKEIDYPNFEILVVVTDKDDDYYNQLKKTKGISVCKAQYRILKFSRLANAKNILRNVVLGLMDSRSYDYLFHVDSDVIVPKDALTKLIFHKKKMVGAPVPIGDKKDPNRVPCVLKNFKRNMDGTINYYLMEELGDELIKVPGCGVGCLLIHRSVLQNVYFKNAKCLDWADDITFLAECHAKGYDSWCDPTIVVEHDNVRWEEVVNQEVDELKCRFDEIKDKLNNCKKLKGSLKEITPRLSGLPEVVNEYDIIEKGVQYKIW